MKNIPHRGIRFALLGLLVAFVALIGCSRRPDSADDSEKAKPVEDPWPRLVTGIRKESDAQSCRRFLSQVSAEIAVAGKAEFQPDTLPPSAEGELRKTLGLTEEQLVDLRNSSYSSLDAQYLAECLYLRDVAKSLELDALPPQRKAELAFAWICRQVVLAPAKRYTQTGGIIPNPPFPPTFILRRGSGSGLERMYVYLALLQQLGLEGCLLGPAAAFERPWSYVPVGGRSDEPKGPFTAVGVRIGSEIHLFDPWRGSAFPGTLKQLQADATLLKPWLEDKAKPWDGSVELVKELVPVFAHSLNAYAPRMKRLEQELRNAGGVKVSIDPVAFQAQFQKETQIATVKFWNPPQDPYALCRVLSGFLPREEGGSANDQQLYANYLYGSLPVDLITMVTTQKVPPQYAAALSPLRPSAEDPNGLPEVIARLADIALTEFRTSFLTTPLPREMIQRGRFFEVAPDLTRTRERYISAQNRLRTDRNRDQDLTEWAKKTKDLYLAASLAKSSNNPADLAQVAQRMEAHWKSGANVITSIVDLFVAETGLAEATYLFATSTHEQAERAYNRYQKVRSESKAAATIDKSRLAAYEACAESVGWWEKYKPFAEAQNSRFPGRSAQALELAERMTKLTAELKP
jgi:hypothetical protein